MVELERRGVPTVIFTAERFVEDARRSAALMLNKEPKALLTAHPELGWLRDHPDLPLPVVEDPGCFEIAVVGGAAGRGAYFFGAGEPVTMPVED